MGGYMDEDGCGSSGVWNILPDVSIDDVVLSVYNWDYFQVGLCDVLVCCYDGVDLSFDQIDYI